MDRRRVVSAGALIVSLLALADLHAFAQAPAVPEPPVSCPDAARLDALLADSAQAFNSRDTPRGLSLLRDAFDQATRLGCPVQRAEALMRFGIADYFERRLPDAERKFREAADEFRRLGEAARECVALTQLGNALISNGRGADAVAPLVRARELARGMKDVQLELRVLSNLAYAMDEGPEKTAFRADALALVRSVPAGRGAECDILHEWGDSLFAQDRYREAFPVILEAVACFEDVGTPSQIGRAYTSLGRVYRAHGRLAEALEQYSRAVAIQQNDRGDPLGSIQSLNAIGVTLGAMGKDSEGLERLQEALSIARRRAPGRTVDFLLGNIATFYLDQGRYAEAASTVEEILGKPTPYETLRLADLSRAYLGLKRREDALAAADRALAAARSESEQVNGLMARVNALIALKRFDEAAADLRRALAGVEALRANTIADDFLKRGFSQRYQGLFSSSISLLEDQGRTRDAIETAERARARAFLDLLAARGRPGGANGGAAPATFDDITAAAARMRSTVIAYWVSPEETFVWVVEPNGAIASARIRVTSTALARLIQEATGAGSSAQAQMAALMLRRGTDTRPWRALYRTLLEPVRRHLPAPGGRLTVVPHGPLFGVPFAALVDPAGRYLIESYELHYVPAIGALSTAPRAPANRSGPALLVGDPGPEAARDRVMPLPALPWADREVSAIDRLLPARALVLRGRDASEAAVRRELEGRTLLHFATHGIVQNEEHLASYLALRSSADGGDAGDSDGRLTANETYGLRLDADLIVLSGCRTAMGPIMGDGVIGFTRAFLAAGAASVVATMWDVPDQTSFEVMKSFYESWVAGADTSRALRRAQLSVLRSLRAGRIRVNGVALPESPRFWAGYVLVGQP